MATDVGSCRELIEGIDDDYGDAGICVPPMHQTNCSMRCLIYANMKEMRLKMGEAGYQRVKAFYGHDKMVADYQKVYQEAIESWQA